MDSLSAPIPPLVDPAGWEKIKIIECGEPLISVRALQNPRIRVRPEYFLKNTIGALDDCYVRKGVATRLVEAAKKLPDGMGLLVLDGWRPPSVQQSLFDEFLRELASANPKWPTAKLRTETRRYVSLPSGHLDRPAPHLTGGSVDLTLFNENGDEPPMGSPFDTFADLAGTRYFEERLAAYGVLDTQERKFLENRRVLFHVLNSVGFRNYCEEWWHFDFGNQFWASVVGSTAIYGPTDLNPNV